MSHHRSIAYGSGSVQTKYTRIDFPKFFGDDPSGWICNCERFFEFNHTEEDHKVMLVVVHLDDKTIQWYQWFEKTQPAITWKKFMYGLQLRFGANAFENATGELTKLRQNSTVRAYQKRFEELANRTTGLIEEFFVNCFLSGLREDIKAGVQMFQPKTISQAIGLARLQEENTEAINRHARVVSSFKPSTNTWGPSPSLAIPKPPVTSPTLPNPNQLIPSHLNQKNFTNAFSTQNLTHIPIKTTEIKGNGGTKGEKSML